LLDLSGFRQTIWHYLEWGAKALVAMGKTEQAIAYAQRAKGLNAPGSAIAAFCEQALLDTGFAEEAYARYAIEASHAPSNLGRFKALCKKYPQVPKETILRDLVASQPGQEGKWFAAAKDAGFFELAIELANRGPTDPRTLIRAARDFAPDRPAFALASGLAALQAIANGWGYEITGADVLDAYACLMTAAAAAQEDEGAIKAQIRELIATGGSAGQFVGRVLERRL
jgi:hypothetical protein